MTVTPFFKKESTIKLLSCFHRRNISQKTLPKALLIDLWKLWTQYSTGTLLNNDPQQSAKLKQLAIQHSKEVKVS